MDNWGFYERRVTSNQPTRKGKRFPIKWTETVIDEGWYFNGWFTVGYCPKPPSLFGPADADEPTESFIYQRIYVPTWIKQRRSYEEQWMIADEKSEPVCYGRRDWGWYNGPLTVTSDVTKLT